VSDVGDGQRKLLDGIKFAESPRWHAGRLWFSDVHDYAVKRVDLDGRVARVADVPGRPAGMGFLPDGRLLLATALDRKLVTVDTERGELTEVADLSDLAQGALNDMVVDPAGRAYVGDVGFQFGKDEPRPGRVILWTEEEGPRVAAEETTFPNGCAVDGDRYVLAETLARRITEFEVTADGALGERRVLAELDDPPDGLCLDAEGGVWVAQPEESRYLRLARDGSVDRIVESADPFAVTCVLGGEDGRTLFLSSADTDLTRLPQGDTSGRIDTLRVEIPRSGRP
jgi:sugar lactone lactonase YvrE